MNSRIKQREITTSLLLESPLSQGQEALWFHYKLAPKSVAYNMAGAVSVPADTDLDALRRAFQKVTERHPMLRTLFATEHGKPVQRVHASSEIAFQIDDASNWDTTQLDDRLTKEIYCPFDLERGPTWRVVVFREAPIAGKNNNGNNPLHEHLVLLVLHHIIADLWSIAILMSEVAALYQQEKTGSPAPLKPIKTNFADHVQKELQRLSGPPGEVSKRYWQTALSGKPAPLSLTSDRPRQHEPTGRGAAHSVLLDKILTNKLRALARKQHVPLYTVLLTGFQTLLHRYTGQNDILVGFPKAGRGLSTVRIVGYFINQMVVRTDFSKELSFIDLLNNVQKTIEAGSRHDWYPFSLVFQNIQHEREPNHSPFIQTVFSWQQAPRPILRENTRPLMLRQADQSVELDGLFMRSVHLPCRAAPFDLMMLAAEVPDGLAITIEYATDLFDPATIARIGVSYQTLLESITSTPGQLISSVDILPKVERKRLIKVWNDTDAPYPSQLCLHQLFEGQVERTPEAEAVVSGNDRVTYSQLNRWATQLAHVIQEQGFGPNCLVGVCLQPSMQTVMAILGILKAGGIYLPLDPNNPTERLAVMLADARPDLLITSHELSGRLDFAGAFFLIDADVDKLATLPQTNPSSRVSPDHPAYVIYTSGSTGLPKGVILAHRGVVNLLAEFQRRQSIQPGEACSWWTSPSFDVSVYEIFSPLLAGGSLHVIPENIRLDTPSLCDWLQDHSIRSAYLPPFLLEDFAAWVQIHPGVSKLRRLLVGVEPILYTLLTSLKAQIPNLCILNGYGPTETTICSTLYEVDTEHPHPGNTPIGRPVANTQIYLLDSQLQPVPVGVVGELYIGGVGLAHGYLNHPDLTAQRFVQSPFLSEELLYRTGDLARYLPDGNLMFIGRSDTQVKLHGMRIELGEVETNLSQHPEIKQAVVRLHEQTSCGKQLVAYIVASHNPPPSPKELRAYLSLRLHPTMIPSTFVVLDAFPLTTTGKVDRKALTVPEELQAKQRLVSQPPQTNVEKTLASIFQQVLGAKRIGRNDNFFELGGDSILSLQVVALAAEVGLRLRPGHIFQAPTIAELATIAKPVRSAQELPIEESPDGAIPLSPIQHWFFQMGFPDLHQWNQSFLLIPTRQLDPVHLRSAVFALLRQHDSLRLRFENGASGWQQTLTESVDQTPFEVIDLSTLSRAQQEDAIDKHVAAQQSNLNLSTGPLIRVVLFVSGANLPGRLLIVIHHLVVDSVSWGILLEDLESAYLQEEHREPILLPAKTTAFHTWARRLAAYAQSPEIAQEVGFWQRMIETRQQTTAGDLLFPDRTYDQQNTEGSARRVSVSLKYEETQSLLHRASDTYGTEIVDLLLTALVRAFQHLTGTEVFRIDLEAHGREDLFEDIDLSRSVGWFTSLYPVCLELPLNAGIDRSIKSVKEQLHRIPQHGLGYGLLRYLVHETELSERLKEITPAPVCFNYLGQLSEGRVGRILSGEIPQLVSQQRNLMAQRPYLIEINAAIYRGELSIEWIYSSHIHSRESIEQVAGFFIDELHDLIAHCRSSQMIQYTPSDFPNAGLTQQELDTIVRLLSRTKAPSSRRNLEAIYPLSPMQQGMIFHTLYTPGSGIYFEQTTFTIQGQFDVSAFEKAWRRVLDRQTILRTSFVWQGLDRMLQVVHRDVEAPLLLEDWQEIPLTEQQDRFEHLLAEERRRGFDLSVPPLLRLNILQINDDTYTIVLNHHHALLDGWSVSLLFQEIFTFYDAIARNEDLALPPAKSYQDYISWLQTQDLAAVEAFWRKELEDFDAFTLNPQLTPSSPPTGASQPAELAECLSISTTTALQALAQQQHLTISTLVQGAWAILLHQILQRDDVLFGVTVSGRSSELPECLTMIGLFINTLPLRVHIDPRARLHEWLQDLQSKGMEIQQFDYSPLAQIQAWSGLPRSSHLFETILVFENYPAPINQENFASLRIGHIRSIEQTNYPLTIAITPGHQLSLRMLYDPARFDSDKVQRLLYQLQDVLENMIFDPNQRLAKLCEAVQFEPIGFVVSESGKDEAVSSQTNTSSRDRRLGEYVPKKHTTNRGKQLVTPISPLEKYLAEEWKKLLNIEQLNVNDNFFQLGGDSLKGAVCTHRLQDATVEAIPLNAIFNAPTISEYAQYLEQNHPAGIARLFGKRIHISEPVKEETHPTTMIPIQPHGNQPPLFCIHPAGGIVFPYYTLAAYFDKERPLYGIQDPSLYNCGTVQKSIETMAADYIEAIKTVQPEGPYHLLGWSAGGVIAYEMAQQLSRLGQSVSNLIMLDTAAPGLTETSHSQPLRKEWRELLVWIKALPNHVQAVSSVTRAITSYIHSGLFLLAASSKRGAPSSGGRPTLGSLLGWVILDTWRAFLLQGKTEIASTVSQETSLLLIRMPVVRRILELVREHRRLVLRYAAENYNGKITLFRAMASGPKKKASADPTLGWGILAQKGVEVRYIQANHVALFVNPHVKVLAHELMKSMNRK